jgi:molybdenum cofactor cytidylyltransferase
MIAGVFLAAGQSTRFGSDKLLYELDGRPLVAHGLAAAVKSRLPDVVVVVGLNAFVLEKAIRDVPATPNRIRIVKNEHPERGMMSSLKQGLRAVLPACDAAMVMLADMPYVTAELMNRLIETFEDTNGIVMPECDGELYHPRVIPRRLFPEFLRLKDDDKGQSVIDKHREDIVGMAVDKKTSFIDIDEARDLDT